MKKTLKEIFSIREVAINIPDEDLPMLQRVVMAAIKAGKMPPSAKSYIPGLKGNKSAQPTGDADSDADRPEIAAYRARRDAASKPPSAPPQQQKQAAPAPDMQKSTSAWDALGPKANQKQGKAQTSPRSDFPSLPAPKSANVDLGPADDDGEDVGYKSPFAWDQIDPTGTSSKTTIPDRNTGGIRDLDQSAPQKGPGLAGRAAAGIKNAFKKKPSDGRKELDKAIADLDRKSNGKQGALSRIFKGKDVTKGQP